MKVWLCSEEKKTVHKKIIRLMYRDIKSSITRKGLEYEVGFFRGYSMGIVGEGILSNWAFLRYYEFFNMLIAKKRMELMHEAI